MRDIRSVERWRMIPAWASVPIEDNAEPLVDLAAQGFIVDPMYFKAGLSVSSRIWMREGAAERLKAVEHTITPHRLKIWDAWRPREVQKQLYESLFKDVQSKNPRWSSEAVRDEVVKYVNEGADPLIVPPHATGGTADLTVVDSEGRELDMGTGFDHFGIEAAPFYFDDHPGNDAASRNRKLLRDAMLAQGFCPWPHEWWHYEFGTQNWALTYGKPAALYGALSA